MSTRKEAFSVYLQFVGWLFGLLCASQLVYAFVLSAFFAPWSMNVFVTILREEPDTGWMVLFALLSGACFWWAKTLDKRSGM